MVDDEGDIIESYIDLLSEKYDISAFPDAETFINYVTKPENAPFELAVIDYNLGGKNGLEMIVELKKLNITTPFVLMSGYLNKDSTLKAHNVGVSKILEKPVNYQILDEEMASVLLETQLIGIQKKTRELAFEINSICSACSIYFNEFAERTEANQFFDILSRQLRANNLSFKQATYFDDFKDEIFRHIKTEELLIRQIQRKKSSLN